MSRILEELLAPRPFYEDGGAGACNAAALKAALVRPAFFDVSCLTYRLMYAKAEDYCKKCGADAERMAHMIAADVMFDIADACRNFACAPVLAFDSVRRLRKEQILPTYKDGRLEQKKTKEVETVLACRFEAMRLLKRVYAPGYKVQCFCMNGYESDDIIASFVLGLKQNCWAQKDVLMSQYDKPVVIVSSDHDLHQIVTDGVMFADVTTGVLCTAADIEKHWKIACRDVVAAKCVGGGKSDHVGNVPGCGEKTVAEFLQKRNFDVTVKKARAALNSPEGEEILRRNLKLVRLPYEGDPPMPPPLLSAKVWPKAGIPEDMAAMMDSNGVPRAAWPSFADVTLPRPAGAVPMCAYNKKVTQ